MNRIRIQRLILTLALNCVPLAVAEQCFEIEGVGSTLTFNGGIMGTCNFKASVGKSGFAFTVEGSSESRRGEFFVLGGENGIVAAIQKFKEDSTLLGHVSTPNDVPFTGPGPGGILYSLFGNYSQQLRTEVQIPLIQMIVNLRPYDLIPPLEIRQTWQFDSKFPFGAHSMDAYVLPGLMVPQDSRTPFYREGWRIGTIKVIKRDHRSFIPLLVEAIWSVPRESVNQQQSPDQVDPWVIDRLEVTRIAEGERVSYLPQIKTKPLSVVDQRGKKPNGKFLDYNLRPGELWATSDSPEFFRKQSESLAAWKEGEKATRRPILASITMLTGSGIILFFIIRFSRQRPDKSSPQ